MLASELAAHRQTLTELEALATAHRAAGRTEAAEHLATQAHSLTVSDSLAPHPQGQGWRRSVSSQIQSAVNIISRLHLCIATFEPILLDFSFQIWFIRLICDVLTVPYRIGAS